MQLILTSLLVRLGAGLSRLESDRQELAMLFFIYKNV